jgi:murein DD-endopeptidase MepM/ murein hydrolase activator NlpD
VAIADPGDDGLARAEDSASAAALDFEKLNLTNLRTRTKTPVQDALTNASCTRTVEGASTLVLTFDDKDMGLLRSGALDINADGRLDPIDVMLDTLVWRVVKAEPSYGPDASELKLTCEEQSVALLGDHDRPFKVSRNAMTRAEFAHRMVREVKARKLAFYSPEEHFAQSTAKTPRSKKERDAQRQPGFADGVKLKIEGATADADQLREIETSLTVADEENATGRARLAQMCAGIGESGFRAIRNLQGSKYSGVYQADPAKINPKDTESQARHFLRGGLGFQAGGAIAAAAAHPDWSPGRIALEVEGSKANFGGDVDKGTAHYQAHIGDARAIVAAWTGSASGSSTQRTIVKPYEFHRGLPGKRETSWEALQRLASEVGWRCFVVAGVVYFISEEQLFMSRSRAEISFDTPGLISIDPGSDWDAGKTVAQLQLTVAADRWGFPPGSIIALRDLGTFNGRWLVHTVDRPDLTDPLTQITLTKPIASKHEPAADTIQVPRSEKDKAGPARVESTTAAYPLSKQGSFIQGPYGNGTHGKAFNQAGGSDNWESENAVDIGVPVSTRVFAVDAGTIGSSFGSLGEGGRFAGLRLHLVTARNEWYYAHLSKFASGIAPGVKVKAGDLLGYSGEANGVAHLHLACKTGSPDLLIGIHS